jgi:hypothetical protein
MIIKRVGVMSVAKMMGGLYGLLGLIIGVPFGLLMMLGMGAAMMGTGHSDSAALGAGVGMGMGLGMMILFPIFYAVLGLVAGLIMGALYNLAAGYMGGVEIDVE